MANPTQYAVMLDVRAAAKRAAAAGEDGVAMAEELCRMVNHFVAAARFTLETLGELTSEDFARGGDRDARAALVAALDRCGQASAEEVRDYRPVAVLVHSPEETARLVGGEGL